MKYYLYFPLVIFLTACASSGVVQTGPNAYVIAKSEWGFTSGAVHAARLTKEAASFCMEKGLQVRVINANSNDVEFGKTPAAEIVFECVPK